VLGQIIYIKFIKILLQNIYKNKTPLAVIHRNFIKINTANLYKNYHKLIQLNVFIEYTNQNNKNIHNNLLRI